MDYIAQLKAEATSGHASFHEFVLSLSRTPTNCRFFFFEGEDDPAFYIRFAADWLAESPYREHICMGKRAVLKAFELVQRDGRAVDRCFFFVDKDHSDLMGEDPVANGIYQTETYSFENYIVCRQVFRRYWSEYLHLSVDDTRYDQWLHAFDKAHGEFSGRSRLLMAAVLIGRGILGDTPVKLNLNNANLDNVFAIDASAGKVVWKSNGVARFLAAVNLDPPFNLSQQQARKVARQYLRGNPQLYIRGKYELWFFIKFLQSMTRLLSDRHLAASNGIVRATPKEDLKQGNSVHTVGTLTPCPAPLRTYLSTIGQAA